VTVVVLAPNWLGDAVMALPALADLRRHVAEARLVVAARRSVSALFPMVPGVDAVVTLPGKGGIAALGTWRDDVTALREAAGDVAILFPNSLASALVALRSGIVERWGLATDGRRRLLTRAVPRPHGHRHQAAYYQALTTALGVPPGPRVARVQAPAPRAGLIPAAGYVVLAPGAAYGRAKQWPVEQWAALATMLADEGWPTVLVGSGGDRATCAEVQRRVPRHRQAQVMNVAGMTSLAELAAVLVSAAAVVSNDSGAMHLAAATGAPVVAVFGATDETRTAPVRASLGHAEAVVLTAEAWCRPCMLRECPIDHRCMTGVTATRVAEAVRSVAAGRDAGRRVGA